MPNLDRNIPRKRHNSDDSSDNESGVNKLTQMTWKCSCGFINSTNKKKCSKCGSKKPILSNQSKNI